MPPPKRAAGASEARASLVALLESEGASHDSARRIVDELLSCGLSPARARVWLSNGNRCYPIAVPGWAWRQVPTHAIEEGRADLVLEHAERFAASSENERVIAMSLSCDMDDVSRLTGQDPQRAATIRAVLKLLRKQLGTDTRVYDVIFSYRWPPLAEVTRENIAGIHANKGPRMIDLVLERKEASLLKHLEADEVDLQDLLANGLLQVGF
jgi:hypothetical protein